MRISKRQLKRIIKEEKAKLLAEGMLNEDVILYLVDCYNNSVSEEACGDGMPNAGGAAEIMDFANFIMRVANEFGRRSQF